MNWAWLSRKMEMDAAEEEFEKAKAALEQALYSWRKSTEDFTALPKYEVEPHEIGTN